MKEQGVGGAELGSSELPESRADSVKLAGDDTHGQGEPSVPGRPGWSVALTASEEKSKLQ